jgi:hypothetical protein
MSVCITTNYLDPSSIYPVADPRRTVGGGPWGYGYAFCWDVVTVEVSRNPSTQMSDCLMTVNFATSLTEPKEIQAWNIFANNFVARIGSSSLGLPASMTIQKADCAAGTDTVILCRHFAWPRQNTALYTFSPNDFWDFWGGCTVSFNWQSDTQGSGLWGNQTPPIAYPIVDGIPDGTLFQDGAGGFIIVFGGAGFAADQNFLNANSLNPASALPFPGPLPKTPVDGTLVREMNAHQVFICFGGAKFAVPRFRHIGQSTPFAFDPSLLRIIPQGGAAQIPTIPFDGTLLREQDNAKVFQVRNGQLSWVPGLATFDADCFAWRNVRIVPDGTLNPLPHGPDLPT